MSLQQVLSWRLNAQVAECEQLKARVKELEEKLNEADRENLKIQALNKALQAELAEAQKNIWIDVNDRLPDEPKMYLVKPYGFTKRGVKEVWSTAFTRMFIGGTFMYQGSAMGGFNFYWAEIPEFNQQQSKEGLTV